MPTKRELLVGLREDFEELPLSDKAELDRLRRRGAVLARLIFGSDSPHIEELASIQFSRNMPMASSSSGSKYPSDEQRRKAHENAWRSGRTQSVNLVDAMLQELDLTEATRQEDDQVPSGSNPDHVFVVHGHDNEMKLAVAWTVKKLGLEPVILHEQPDRGQAIIEKIERHSDVGFAVVSLSPDDIGYLEGKGPDAARPRARQNVIFELGYFAGKLGRANVVALYRGEIELPSDYDGVLYTRYDGDSGAWRNRLVLELQESGYDSANRL
jgi:predicted nucleotide-binding protein